MSFLVPQAKSIKLIITLNGHNCRVVVAHFSRTQLCLTGLQTTTRPVFVCVANTCHEIVCRFGRWQAISHVSLCFYRCRLEQVCLCLNTHKKNISLVLLLQHEVQNDSLKIIFRFHCFAIVRVTPLEWTQPKHNLWKNFSEKSDSCLLNSEQCH